MQRQVKNPLYGRKIPKEVKEQLPAEIRELMSRKTLRIPGPTAEILPIQKQLKVLLKRVWPDGSDEDLSGLSVTLAGLWEVSRKHIILIRKLLGMKGKLDRKKLQDISRELDVNWLSYASDHLSELRPALERLKYSLYAE